MKFLSRLGGLFPALLVAGAVSTGLAADKKVVLIAGPPSHGPAEHEHRAGCLLLQQCLNQLPGIHAEVYTNGWPHDPTVLAGAAAVAIRSSATTGSSCSATS
jgi:hypothetical protein